MYILGIGSGLKLGHHDGSAALVKDNMIVAAAEEERFLRAKHARGELPLHAIHYCLQEAGITIQDVDVVASPLITYTNYDRRLQDWFKFHFGYSPPIQLLDHHLCHAASTYRLSGFDDAMIMSFDFSGDSCSGLLAVGRGDTIEEVRRFERRNSLGLFYGMLTQFLGFQMTNDEFKVMGLASYGQPKYEREFSKILEVNDEGYLLNKEFDKRNVDAELYTTDFVTRQEQIFSEAFVNLLGQPRLRTEKITQHHMDLAASGQRQLEKACLKSLEIVARHSNSKNLCLAGGITLNVKMNSVLFNADLVDNIFIQPAAGDAGMALGAAVEIAARHSYRFQRMNHVYYGPAYTDEQIETVLRRLKLAYSYVEDIERRAAEDIAEGKIMGWFQGRMEFGPRALGNRSILADPRDGKMKDRINGLVKFREEFRPFCPSILEERRDEYFENSCSAPFMILLFNVKEDKRAEIPAVTHVDGTARIQTISKKTNPSFWTLIKYFDEITSVPVVLNTSLNIKGEPIVESPEQAIRVFYGSGMDSLALGNFYLTKP